VTGIIESAETDQAGRLFRKRHAQERKADPRDPQI
jgi:hypothetical protein